MTASGPPSEDDPRLLRDVLDATQLLVVVVDGDGVVRLVNRAVEATTGLARADTVRPIWELAELPVERELLRAAFCPLKPDAFPSGLVFHLASTTGQSRMVDWEVRPLRDERDAQVTVLTGVDVSDRLMSQQRLRETESFQRLVLDRLPAIVWTTDKELRTTFSAGGGLAALGLASGEMALMRTPVSSYFQTDDPTHIGIASHLRALEGESCVFEMTWFGRQYQSRLEPLRDSQESIVGTIGLSFDMTEQARLQKARDDLLLEERKARRETELANARLSLLVDGSKRLSRTMSANETLETLASVVIPGLADWSFIVHRGWNGGPTLVASAHGDPKKREMLHRLDGYVSDPSATEGPPHVLRTQQAIVYSNIADEDLGRVTLGPPHAGNHDPEQDLVLRALGVRSLLCVPIVGRHGVDAVLMMVSADNPRRYGPEDVVLGQDLASRAAVSLENGRLLFEALDAVRARDDFLAIAAHELRTPLTSLSLQIQLLDRTLARDRLDVGTAVRGLAGAAGQARRLSNLVDGLLDVGRVTSDRMSLRIEELDLRDLVGGVVTAMAQDFERAGCAVTFTAPTDVSVKWDRVRVEQVLTNLLSNAIKFGRGTPIDVRCEATSENVQIAVRDHGPGVAKADQARIFGRFERAVSSRNFGGLGLGLYISAQILRAHQGSVRVESEAGDGACFIVDLPRTIQPSAMVTDLSADISP